MRKRKKNITNFVWNAKMKNSHNTMNFSCWHSFAFSTGVFSSFLLKYNIFINRSDKLISKTIYFLPTTRIQFKMYLFYLRRCCLPNPRGDINLMRVVNRDIKNRNNKAKHRKAKKSKRGVVHLQISNFYSGRPRHMTKIETRDPKR